MTDKLTQKQRAFAVKFVECGNLCEAYRHAYDTKKATPKTITIEAARIAAKPSVALVIQQLKDEANKKVMEQLVIDRKFITEGILRNIKGAEMKEDYSTALRGHDQLAKMYDLYEEKHNDRLMPMKDREAIVNNFKQRMLDVTPEE